MIPSKAIKKVKNEVHLEIAAGSLVAYGVFPQTNEGIQKAKETAASKDTWLAPSDLPEYYNGIDNDLIIGNETDGIRAIRRHLQEFYGLTPSKQKDNKPNTPAGLPIHWYPINQVGERTWRKLKAQLTGIKDELFGKLYSFVNLSERDADKLIENIKKSGHYPGLEDGSGNNLEIYEEWLVDTYLPGGKTNPQPEEDEEDEYDEEGLDDLLGMLADEAAAEEQGDYIDEDEEDDEDIQKALEDLLDIKPDKDGVIIDEDKSKKPDTGSGTFTVEDPNKPKHPKLYPEIDHIKPRYMKGVHGLYDLDFESDIDKAIYFAGKTDQAGEKSKLKADVRKWLQDVTGLNYFEDFSEIKKYRKKILDKIKSIIEEEERDYDPNDPPMLDADAVDVFVPIIYDGYFQDPDQIDEEDVEDEPVDGGKSLEERMQEAFEKNLDDLLDDIKNPEEKKPVPKQGKRRGRKPRKTLPKKPKNKNVTPRKPKGLTYTLPKRGNEKSLAEYFNNKIADSFSLALQANKMNKLSGGPKKPPGFFLRKALFNRFGGDLFNRTVGTFSQSPEAYQDPALSKEQRFAASLAATPPPPRPTPSDKNEPKQLELNLGIKSGSVSYVDKSNPVYDLNARDIIEQSNRKLKKSYDKLANDVKTLFKNKDSKNQVEAEKGSIFDSIPKLFDSIKESVKKGNGYQKELVKVKGETLQVVKDARESEEDYIKEKEYEQDKDLSSSFDYKFDFTKPLEDDDIEEEDRRKKPFDWFGDMFDFDYDRKKKKKPSTRKRISGGRPGSTIKPKKPLGTAGKKVAAAAGKNTAKIVGKGAGKFAAKKIPVAGIFAGVAFGVERFLEGDILGGIGEITSGVVSTVPIIGTALSTAIDVGLMARDMTTPPKLASGGLVNGPQEVMVGEAGPEAIIPLGNSAAQNIVSTLPLTTGLTLPLILGTTKQIVKTTRTASKFEPYMEQRIAPLAKIFGIETIAMASDVGRNLASVKTATKTQENKGFFGSIKKMFSGMFGGGSGRRSSGRTATASPPTSAPVTGAGTGKWGPLLELIASKESGGNYEAMYPSTTLPGATKMTIAEVARRATGAVGKYQQLPRYLVSRAKAAGLNPETDLYSPENQDLIAGKVNIGINRGGDKWLAGKISTEEFMQNLSMEFAALPNSYGNFHYPGQRSSITPDQVRGALQRVKTTPATPAKMDAPVAKAPPQAAGSPFTLQPLQSPGTTPAPATANMQQIPQAVRSQMEAGATASAVTMNVFGTPMVTGYTVSKPTASGGFTTLSYDTQGNVFDPSQIQKYRLGAN